jgi:hypothetical protein
MGKKHKKQPPRRESWVNSNIEDEKLALEAIFGPDYHGDPDDPQRCSLHVVPHEAGLEENYVSATLHLTYDIIVIVLKILLGYFNRIRNGVVRVSLARCQLVRFFLGPSFCSRAL